MSSAVHYLAQSISACIRLQFDTRGELSVTPRPCHLTFMVTLAVTAGPHPDFQLRLNSAGSWYTSYISHLRVYLSLFKSIKCNQYGLNCDLLWPEGSCFRVNNIINFVCLNIKHCLIITKLSIWYRTSISLIPTHTHTIHINCI